MYYFTFQQIFLIDSQIKLYILHIHTEPRISLSKYTIHFTNTPLFFLYSIHFGILTFFFIWKRCTNAIFYTISLNFLGENKHSYSKTKKEKKKKEEIHQIYKHQIHSLHRPHQFWITGNNFLKKKPHMQYCFEENTCVYVLSLFFGSTAHLLLKANT